ncbi:MAG: DUF177 domain-containing protein [Kiritimatiellae bacterium]|nr:DUF177 domain-containing protein [Kiritimatiellia bacterium]
MAEETEKKLLIDVARLDPEGETLEGEADIVDLDEPFVKPFGGVRYSLKAQLFGTELLVRGRLEQDFDLVCSRCGETFDTTVKVDDFTASVEVSQKDQFADLTVDARECIILALPTYPVCAEDCPGFAQKAEKPKGDDRWSALDGLKVE